MDGVTGQTSSLTPWPFIPDGDDLVAAGVSLLRGWKSRSSIQSAPAAIQSKGKDPDSVSPDSTTLLRSVTEDAQAQSGAAEILSRCNSFNSAAPSSHNPSSLSSKRSITHRIGSEDHESHDHFPESLGDDALVKAAVPGDDPHLSISTPRMWTMALTSAVVGSSMNLLFSLRYPSVTLTPIVALLVVYPLGLLWDRALKRENDHLLEDHDGDCNLTSPSISSDVSPPALRRTRTKLRLWLARGRWNRKEHACVFVSSNVSFAFAFATDIITEQVKFYKQDVSMTYQVLLILSSQLLGYSLAGIFSEFLVKPENLVWPGNLVATSMLSALHNGDNTVGDRWRMSRWQFFTIVFGGSFVYYFLPGLLFPALSYFNILTWFAPNSVIMANLVSVKA